MMGYQDKDSRRRTTVGDASVIDKTHARISELLKTCKGAVSSAEAPACLAPNQLKRHLYITSRDRTAIFA